MNHRSAIVTSFDLDLTEKELSGAEHISAVGRELISAFMRKVKEEGLKKQEVADLLEVDKSVVSRMLRGDANLTLRSVGEICWALGVRPVFSCDAGISKQGLPNSGRFVRYSSQGRTARKIEQRVYVA